MRQHYSPPHCPLLFDSGGLLTHFFISYSLYDYINNTLISVLQYPYWYGDFMVLDPGLMIDYNNKYLGTARMRQLRLQTNICEIAEAMKFLKMTCWPEYNLQSSETRPFGYGWGNISYYLNFDRLSNFWKYSGEGKTGTLPVLGKYPLIKFLYSLYKGTLLGQIAMYPGGGYLAFLGRTLHNSYINFKEIVSKSWIDQKTRSVFVEFLTYNVNTNVFNAVNLLYEQSATGYVHKKIYVSCIRNK